ncbi:hypothetical protein ILUMI_04166 [Ignelater luminosus]|uniref:Neprilysin n=1 Tax=Ignelater luminosus TaxID=2038154 RepID=A0A8K0D9G0_IGNLU|nr:hypothetical protein ILUMI_04166 [Ignelater luminosus]
MDTDTSEDHIVRKNSSWWDRRTTAEKGLIVVLAITLLATVIVACLYIKSIKSKQSISSEESSTEENVCLSLGCVHTASNIIKYLDTSVNPCDDFYQFACGGFLQNTNIPDDELSISAHTDIQQNFLKKLKGILEEPTNPKDLKPFKLIRRLYKICMDTEAIENDEYETLIDSILKPLGGWPVLEDKFWKENVFNWKNLTYQLRKMGLSSRSFLNVYTSTDMANSSRHQIRLEEPVLSLNRDEYLEGFSNKAVKAYYDYMVDIAVILGADTSFARKEMKEALRFEIELGKLLPPIEESRNISAFYNPTAISELQKKYLTIRWLDFINNVIDLPDVKVKEDEIIDVSNPGFIEGLLRLLNKTPRRVQANYALFRTVHSTILYLTKEIKDRQQEYFNSVLGISEQLPRWKECTSVAVSRFYTAAGALYVRKYFDKEAKDDVTKIVMDIHSELNKTLEEIDWMDENTKSKAFEKADSMKFHIAYSDEFFNDKAVEDIYTKLTVASNNYLLFNLNLQRFTQDDSFSKLRKLVDKDDLSSHLPPISINAAYSPSSNAIDLPAGILQGVFFESDRPSYINYGGIGYVVGHEIVHGFDDQGRKFDKNGNLEEWWAKDTEKAFLQKAKCFATQYGNLKEPTTNMKLNGLNTQGENIADNGGIKLAYAAYQAWVERNGEEPTLPGLNYTQNQMFWIAAANTWCNKVRKETLAQLIPSDVHSPACFRVTIPFSNTESFAEDFNCPLGSKMNPKEKCQIW